MNRCGRPPRIVRFEINDMPRPKPVGFLDKMPTVTRGFPMIVSAGLSNR